MDMKRHLKSALKHLGFDKPRKAQIIPMNTLDAEPFFHFYNLMW